MAKNIILTFLMLNFAFLGCSSGKSATESAPTNIKKKTPTTTQSTHTTKHHTNKHHEPKNEAIRSKTQGVYGQEVLESTSRTTVSSDMVYNYVMTYSEIAMQNMRDYGIPASIILAQGVLESGSGKGELSSKSNNHFGIKCHKEWTGESVTHDDDTKGECFRKYKDPAESYRDHALFLTSRPRYNSLFQLPKDDYEGWAKGLRAAGYASDPGYPQKLIGLIERYQLYKFDYLVTGKLKPENFYIEVQPYKTSVNQNASVKPVLMTEQVPAKPPIKESETIKEPIQKPVEVVKKQDSIAVTPPVVVQKVEEVKPQVVVPVENEKVVESQASTTQTQEVAPVADSDLEVNTDFLMIRKSDATYAIFPIQNLYKVNQGDTLYSISRKFNVTVAQLTEWNRISDNSIAIGQILRVK